MTSKQPIPNMLRFYRKRSNLLQSDVALKLNLTSTDRISHWEKGQAYPSVVNLFKLAATYQVPPHNLYPDLARSIPEEIDDGSTGATAKAEILV